MTTATLSVIPSALFGSTIAGLLGPLSVLALLAVGVAFGALLAGLVAENRDAQTTGEMARTADVVPFRGRPRDSRAAA